MNNVNILSVSNADGGKITVNKQHNTSIILSSISKNVSILLPKA